MTMIKRFTTIILFIAAFGFSLASNAAGVEGIRVTARDNMNYSISPIKKTISIQAADVRGMRDCFLVIQEGTPQGWKTDWTGWQCGVVSTFAAFNNSYGHTYGYRAILYGTNGSGALSQRGWIGFKTKR